MKATLKPLSGKYYGTEILVDFEDGHSKEKIKLWDSGDFSPSVRELERYGLTQEMWDNDVEMENGWGGMSKVSDLEFFCDTHFESKLTYERALKLIKAINNA